MKKIFIRFLMMGFVGALMLASCKKDETNKVTATSGTAGALTASTTTPTLTKATLSNTAITFSATNPNYGYSAAVTNTLQLALKGTNFAKTIDVSIPAGTISKSYTVQDFNNLLLSMNLPYTSASQLEVRLKSQLSSAAGIVYSNVVTVTATPFPLTSYVYAPGAYQGWDPPTADSLQSATGNGVYVGIINFTAGNLEFKITPAKKWDVAYGDAGSGKVSTSGGNLKAPAAGKYFIVLDLNANTIVFAKADFFGVIGSASPGDWSSDTEMKFNNGTQAWETVIPLKVGEIKFRMNGNWDTSYGVPKSNTDGFGVANTLNFTDNNNIAVASAGTYKATFKVTYITDVTKAVGTIDKTIKTATYTLVKQ